MAEAEVVADVTNRLCASESTNRQLAKAAFAPSNVAFDLAWLAWAAVEVALLVVLEAARRRLLILLGDSPCLCLCVTGVDRCQSAIKQDRTFGTASNQTTPS